MSDLSEEQIDRLESAHAIFSQADGAARARLLAALAAEGPPTVQTIRKSRIELMKRYATRGAIAAALLVAATIAWQLNRPAHLFAQVAGAMSQAKGTSCDMIMVSPGYNYTEKAELIGHVFWIPSGEERADNIRDGKPYLSEVHRPGQDGLELNHDLKVYRILHRFAIRPFSFGLIAGLGEYRGKAEPIPGMKLIRGVKAEGFTVPWTALGGDDSRVNVHVEAWIDPATVLPVRVDLIGFDPGNASVLRFEDFRWGPQDPALFDTSVPAGYAKASNRNDAGPDEVTQYVKDGLSIYAKYNNGKYPAVKYVYGDMEGEALRKLMNMPKDAIGWAKSVNPSWYKTKEGEFGYGSYCLSWINVIQRMFPDGAYHGKTVTPKDAGKVLLRWQLDNGDYRVIFGDLSSDTVSAARLRELEAR